MATYGSYKKISADSIVVGTIATADIAATTVTASKIANGAVGTSQLINNAVTAAKIANGAVGTSQLASTIDLSSKTVTYRPIANADISATAAITTSKLVGALAVTAGTSTFSSGVGGIGQWFSPGYFGVDRTCTFTNNTTAQVIEYQRVQTAAYSWWFIISSGTAGGPYTVLYGARIDVPTGGVAGDQLSFVLSNSASIVGTPTIPSSGTYFISWLSGNGGSGNASPSGALYGDSNTVGVTEWVSTNVAPTSGGTYNIVSANQSYSGIHIRCRCSVTGLTGLAASAFTNSLNADNINQGTLGFARGARGAEGGIHVESNGQKTGGSQQTMTWRVSGGARNQFILNNSGSTFAFDGTTFTTYQPGTYVMLCEIITYQSTGQIDMFYQKNGGTITDFRGGSDIGNHAAVSGRLTINLVANDNVRINAQADNGMHEDYYTQWSVTKLGGWS
jgi:hypothetical protein